MSKKKITLAQHWRCTVVVSKFAWEVPRTFASHPRTRRTCFDITKMTHELEMVNSKLHFFLLIVNVINIFFIFFLLSSRYTRNISFLFYFYSEQEERWQSFFFGCFVCDWCTAHVLCDVMWCECGYILWLIPVSFVVARIVGRRTPLVRAACPEVFALNNFYCCPSEYALPLFFFFIPLAACGPYPSNIWITYFANHLNTLSRW